MAMYFISPTYQKGWEVGEHNTGYNCRNSHRIYNRQLYRPSSPFGLKLDSCPKQRQIISLLRDYCISYYLSTENLLLYQPQRSKSTESGQSAVICPVMDSIRNVIRFVSISAKSGICTVVGLNKTSLHQQTHAMPENFLLNKLDG